MVSRSSSLRRLVQHSFSVASQPRRGDCDITVKCTCIYFVSRQPSLDFMRVRVEGACQIEMKFPCTSSQSHCESLILRCSSRIAYSIYIYTYKVIYIYINIYIFFALLLDALLIISSDAAFVAALPLLHCSFRRVKFCFLAFLSIVVGIR